jgi:shikimate kinase
MRIYLIGYMGCGKTSLGKKLAEKLGLSFIDLDKYIEERNYKTVPQLFAEFGEDEFRKRESHALQEVSEFTDVVIATGGGAPCFFNNMELMNKSGITVYMDADPGELTYRLLKSKNERPLIKGKSLEELTTIINQMLEIRRPFYTRAKLIINLSDNILEEVAEKIKELIKKG